MLLRVDEVDEKTGGHNEAKSVAGNPGLRLSPSVALLRGQVWSTFLLPRRTAVRPHLLLATEAKNNCTYAFLPEKQLEIET